MAPKQLLLPLSLFLFLFLATNTIVASSIKCNPHDGKVFKRIIASMLYEAADVSDDCCDVPGNECDNDGHLTALVIQKEVTIPGTIPSAVGDLPHLQQLILHKLPNLHGPIIPEIARLTQLTTLWLDWNNLSGPIPTFIATLKNLNYIRLSFNHFTGTIPPELGNLPKLGALFLDRNELTGSIPKSFGNFQSNFLLTLSHNNLTGEVPTSLGRVDFFSIDLSRNKLSGDPSFLFGASKVVTTTIDLSRNMFAFNFSNVKFPTDQLIEVEINHNAIFGKIPTQITMVDRLQLWNVSYNRLCGEIPTGGQMSRFDQSSYIHNRCLCGTPLPPCK